MVPDLELTTGAWFRVRIQKQPEFWKQLQEAVESACLIVSTKGWFRWWNSLRTVVHCERHQPQKKRHLAAERQAGCLGHAEEARQRRKTSSGAAEVLGMVSGVVIGARRHEAVS